MAFQVILMVLLVARGRRGRCPPGRDDTPSAADGDVARNFRLSRKVADEDVTAFGEELSDLHVETLTTAIDDDMRPDYQRALDSYESAKERIRDADDESGVTQATKALEDGRFAMACVLARRDAVRPPARRPPCFFNPAHGPAATDVEWAPLGGVTREIPVCFGCEGRLAERRATRHPARAVGQPPGAVVPGRPGRITRTSRATTADGCEQGLFPSFVLVTATDVPATSHRDPWAGWDGGASGWDDGPGTFDGGGHRGGCDGGGYGGDGGGFDGGGGGCDGGGGGGGGDG